MSLILGVSAFIFSCCCLVGSLITLWPEIATRGRQKNIGWWVWITGSILGMVFFYITTVANPSVETSVLIPLPGVYRAESAATFAGPQEAQAATTTVVDSAATGASPQSANQPIDHVLAASKQDSGKQDSSKMVKADETVQFIGGINGNMYHIPGCYLVDRIPLENQRYFKSRAQAEAAGYKPCPECRP